MKIIIYSILCFGMVHAFAFSSIPTKILISYVHRFLNEVDNGTECVKQLRIFSDDLSGMQPWAFQMLDSSAKLSPGIITGNTMFVGNYDECLQINVYQNDTQIIGQYCRSFLYPSENVAQCIEQNLSEMGIYGLGKTSLKELNELIYISFDICIPAACTSTELQRIWDFTEKEYDLQMHIKFDNVFCETVEKQNDISSIDIVTMVIFGTIALIIFLSTCYDIFIFQKQKEKQNEYDVFMAFSFYTNGKLLFSLKNKHEEKIACLDGLRIITLAWISLGHRTLTNFLKTAVNSVYVLEWFRNDGNMFIIGAFASVDSFFVISGFLIVYIVMSLNEKGIKMNLFSFYIHRILRITPSMYAMILLYAGILRHLGSGPYWVTMKQLLSDTCHKNWWSSLLFVQNYATPDLFSMCLAQAWYLSVDTQLYLLSPLLFLPLQKWPKATITAIVGLIVTSIAATIHTTYYYNLSDKSFSALKNYISYIYFPTHLRAGPWLIGIIFGYFMYKTKNQKFQIKRTEVLLLWSLCLAFMICIMYLIMAIIEYNVPFVIILLFNALSRPIWGLCVCWVIFSCSQGYGGYVNKFLSLSVFNLLSRFTFSIFISHILILCLVEGQNGSPPYLSTLSTFHKIWGDYAFTLGFSVIWTLTFESPIRILEKIIIEKESKRQTRSDIASKKLWTN